MGILYAITEGIRDILSHKLRSILTVLGVVLGASALMTMSAITEGMAEGMRYQMLSTGEHKKITIQPASPPPEQLSLADTSPGLTLRDAELIQKKIDLAEWVSPQIEQRVMATYENRRDRTFLRGSLRGLMDQDQHEEPYGRFFSDLDIQNKNRVAVLGGRVYEKLFPDNYQSAIGSNITINGKNFQVIGIFPFYLSLRQQRQLESGEYERQRERTNERSGRNRFLIDDEFPWKNDLIAIPLTTFQELFKSEASETQVIGDDLPIESIQVGCRDPERMEDLIAQVRSLLLIRHRGIEDFQIEHQLDRLAEVEKQAASARLSGSLIAGIGLVVGGVGIANIMLASIADRIREIGIRRAVGAGAGDIFTQVMMEALLLAIMGGFLGILAGFAIIYFLDEVARIPNQPVLTAPAILFSFSFSLITGFLAGIYPAVKASSLSPVDALRYS